LQVVLLRWCSFEVMCGVEARGSAERRVSVTALARRWAFAAPPEPRRSAALRPPRAAGGVAKGRGPAAARRPPDAPARVRARRPYASEPRGPPTRRPWRGAGKGFLRPESFGKNVEGCPVGTICGGARPERGRNSKTSEDGDEVL